MNSQITIRSLKIIGITFIVVFLFTIIVNAQSGVTSPTGTTGSGVTNPTTSPPADNSAGNIASDSVDINKSTFKLLICDGPEELKHFNPKTNKIEPDFTNPNFVACDFKGLMLQLRRFINIAVVFGVLVAICGFIFAGILYISGKQSNIEKAHKIFPAVFWGFIIMLSAWFIVYQILSWLTGSKSFGVLLG